MNSMTAGGVNSLVLMAGPATEPFSSLLSEMTVLGGGGGTTSNSGGVSHPSVILLKGGAGCSASNDITHVRHFTVQLQSHI